MEHGASARAHFQNAKGAALTLSNTLVKRLPHDTVECPVIDTRLRVQVSRETVVHNVSPFEIEQGIPAHTQKNGPRLAWLLWLVPIPLVWWVLNTVPLSEIVTLAQRLMPVEVVALLVINAVVLLTFTARWWIVLRAMGQRLSFLPLTAYRLASFAVSYFTPGPQFGGEPVQVLMLRRHHSVPVSTGVASVTLEKTIELIVNGLVMFVAAVLVFQSQLLPSFGMGGLVVSSFLVTIPVGILALMWAGLRPLSPLLMRFIPQTWQHHIGFQRFMQGVIDSEAEVIGFCRDYPRAILLAAGVSLISWAMVALEVAVALQVLGLHLPPSELLTLVLAARVAILLPSPGGLGAVEASQILVMQALGYDPALGVGVSLLIRGRDLIFGAAGLLIGLGAAHNPDTSNV